MSRLSVMTVVACTAMVLGSAVHAQQPATPPAPPPPPPAYGEPITLEKAKTAIAAGIAESKKNGWNHVFAVVGPGGNLIALEKMDLATNASSDIAPDKARTAVMFRSPTKVYQDRVAAGETFLLGIHGIVPAAGGIPIIAGGKVIGAIGASGAAPIQDHQSAQAAVDALK